MDAIPDMICFKDGEGRWIFANAAALEMFDMQNIDYRGKTDAELSTLTRRNLSSVFGFCQLTDEKAWTSKTVYREEERIPAADGEERIFDTLKMPLFWDGGERKIILLLGRDITERKKAEEALLASECRQRFILEGANDGIWDWDRKTDAVSFSPRWKEIIGYEDHEIPNNLEEWKRRIHPDDREQVEKANNVFYNSQDSHFQVEYRIRHKDGSYRWILGRGTCERDEHGEPTRMAGAHTDITRLKRAEEQLRESMQRLDFHVKNSPLGAIEWKDGTNIASWSSQAEAMFGWREDEVLGRSWNDFPFIHPDDSKIVREQIADLFEGNALYNTTKNRNRARTAAWCTVIGSIRPSAIKTGG